MKERQIKKKGQSRGTEGEDRREGAVEPGRGRAEGGTGRAETESVACVLVPSLSGSCQPVIYGTETGSSLLCQLRIVTTDS